ncbi:MAG: SGNH/GDSL hydrolase family protein [Candidatus Eisenbacteria bacterium]
MTGRGTSRAKRVALSLVLTVVATLVTLLVAELAVRAFRPQRTMYPRWQYSAEYGAMLFPNRTMVHETPGSWRFEYTTNEHQYRGRAIPVAERYVRENVVVLGDSYSFGTGVNDGEEYAAVMADSLKDSHDVVNLSVGGWGLTQEIRRYFEFGKLYRPSVVIIQFSDNDLRDNFRNQVTVVENGRFAFRNSASRSNWAKRFLSDSPIQRSQLYNLFRQPLAAKAARRDISAGKKRAERAHEGVVPADEQFHNELLELFARGLHGSGVRVLLISAGTSLDRAPFVRAKIEALDAEGVLDYLDTEHWLDDQTDYRSLEGHAWGRKAHAVIGARLSRAVTALAREDS